MESYKIKQLALLFGIRESIIKYLIEEKKDLYSGIAEVLDCKRENVKDRAYFVMYSTKERE